MKLGIVFQPAFVPGRHEQPELLLRELVEDAVLAEELGFGWLWVTEHHFQPFGGLLSAPAVFLAAVSQRTSRLRLGVSVAVLPLHDPLRLAEAWATVDVLSGGRVELGVGRGFSRWEYRTFGVPQEEDRPRRAEALEVLLQAWQRGRVTFRGRHYQYDGVDVLPRPLQRPHPPIWVAAGAEETVRWAAANGYHLMIPLSSPNEPPLTELAARVRSYRAHLAEHGHDSARREVLAQARIYVAPTDEAARDAEPYLARHASLARANQAASSPDGRPLPPGPDLVRAQAGGPGDARPAAWDAQLARGALLAGCPATCAAGLRALASGLGVTSVSLNFGFGGMPAELRRASMRRFAASVLPLLDVRTTSSA